MESFILDRISLLAGILRKSTETNDDNDSAPGEKAPPDTNMKLQVTVLFIPSYQSFEV